MRLLELPSGAILDLDEVWMVTSVQGDLDHSDPLFRELFYKVFLKSRKEPLRFFHDERAQGGYDREKFVAAWVGDHPVMPSCLKG